MYQFKVGDTVKIISKLSQASITLHGEIVVITKIKSTGIRNPENGQTDYCMVNRLEASGGIWLCELELVMPVFETEYI